MDKLRAEIKDMQQEKKAMSVIFNIGHQHANEAINERDHENE